MHPLGIVIIALSIFVAGYCIGSIHGELEGLKRTLLHDLSQIEKAWSQIEETYQKIATETLRRKE